MRARCANCGAHFQWPVDAPSFAELNAHYQCTRCGASMFVPYAPQQQGSIGGAAVGAIIGGVMGGPPGAIIGGLAGMVVGPKK